RVCELDRLVGGSLGRWRAIGCEHDRIHGAAPSVDASSVASRGATGIGGAAAPRCVLSRSTGRRTTGKDGPMTVEALVEDVILRDGSTLRLRVPTRDDEERLIEFFRALSPESRYLRFHGATSVGHETIAPALDTEWDVRGSLLGELESGPVAI